MKTVIEFEAWSRPGTLLPPDFGKTIQSEVWSAGIPRDVFLGVSNLPDETDVAALSQFLEEEPLAERAFYSFCRSNGLPENRDNAASAARYLELLHGCCVAWIHIPQGPDEPALLRKVREAIARFDLIVKPA